MLHADNLEFHISAVQTRTPISHYPGVSSGVQSLIEQCCWMDSAYAWFAANNSVTATGASVTAQTPTTILISNTSATTGFGSTIAMVNESQMAAAGEVYPVHWAQKNSVSNTVGDFYKLTQLGTTLVNEAGRRTGAAASAEYAENEYFTKTQADYFLETFWLAYQAEATSTEASIKVKVEWAGTPTTNLKTAVHAVFVDKDDKIVCDYDMTDAGTEKDFVAIPNSATGTQFKVYLLIDGEDIECYNANASAKEAFGVTVTFTKVET